MRTNVGRNDDGGVDEIVRPTLSIFNHSSHSAGTCTSRYLNDRELTTVHLHVLLNCEEV